MHVAQATYADAKRDYERYKMLDSQGAIAHSILDSAATKLEVAKAQLESAQQQLSLVLEGSRKEEIEAAHEAVAQAQEGVNSASANMKQIEVARANVHIAETSVTQADAALAEAEAAHQTEVMRESDVQQRAGRHRASGGSGASPRKTRWIIPIFIPRWMAWCRRKPSKPGRAWAKASPYCV